MDDFNIETATDHGCAHGCAVKDRVCNLVMRKRGDGKQDSETAGKVHAQLLLSFHSPAGPEACPIGGAWIVTLFPENCLDLQNARSRNGDRQTAIFAGAALDFALGRPVLAVPNGFDLLIRSRWSTEGDPNGYVDATFEFEGI